MVVFLMVASVTVDSMVVKVSYCIFGIFSVWFAEPESIWAVPTEKFEKYYKIRSRKLST